MNINYDEGENLEMRKGRLLIFVLLLISVILVSLFLVSCGISQSEFDALADEKAVLQSERDALINEKSALQNELDESSDEKASLESELDKITDEKSVLQSELDTIIDENDALQNEIDTLNLEKEALQSELDEISDIFPPGDFSSVGELESWAIKNKQGYSEYLDTTFRAALNVQKLGLQDGYLISVMYDEDDVDPTGGWIWNGALVNGQLYIWDPSDGVVYNWYSDWLVR